MPCHAGRDNARGVSYWHPAGFEPICRIIGYLADAIGRWDNAGRAGEGAVAGVFFVLGILPFGYLASAHRPMEQRWRAMEMRRYRRVF